MGTKIPIEAIVLVDGVRWPPVNYELNATLWVEQDGNGPMGPYDRVHIVVEGGEKAIYMAHNLMGIILEDDRDG